MRPDPPVITSRRVPTVRRAVAGLLAALVLALALALALVGPPLGAGASPARPASVAQDPATDLPAPQPDPDQARRDADAILARAEYQEPPKSLMEKVTEWFGEQLQKLFSSFTGGAGGGLAWVILAVLAGVAIYLLTRVRGGLFRRQQVGEEEALFSTALEARRSPLEWLGEAERLEAAGDWKSGLRARYRALVGGLIGEQILRDIPGRTTGEYRVELRRAAPAVADAFAAASDLFERAWYGDEPTGPAESARFQGLASTIAEQARRRAETPVPT